MSCPKCKAEVPGGSTFCNRCGASMTATPAAPAMAAPAAVNEPEQDLWKGRYSGRAQGHLWLLWFLEVGALFYFWFYVLDKIRAYTWASWVVLGAALIPAFLIGWGVMIRKLGIRYRLTNHRLFREKGILSRHIDEIELIRVDDVSVRQNIIQRLFNVGDITVIAPTDKTEPRLDLVGIQNPIEVKEMIRTHVRRRRERSLHVESL